jgi:hypothetical protein
MIRNLRWIAPVLFTVCVFSFVSSQDGKKYAIKTADTPVPKEISEPIQKLLAENSVQLLDGSGKLLCEMWFRKELPTEATPEQLKTGVTFREVKQTEILGAIQFHVAMTDYRKQKMKPGVYTMRLGYQPTDGKHGADVSQFQEFVLVIKAKDDTRPALMEAKKLSDQSGESLDLAHPGVFMLWPNSAPGKEPTITAQAKNHWVVNSKCNLSVAGKSANASIGIGVTLIGHSPAE